jgi:hypothetical protein
MRLRYFVFGGSGRLEAESRSSTDGVSPEIVTEPPVSTRVRKLSKDEIQQAFAGPTGETVPPILTPAQFADLAQLSVKTVYEWIANGRLNGAFRKRGKHNLIWRDRALDILFNGPEWQHESANKTDPDRGTCENPSPRKEENLHRRFLERRPAPSPVAQDPELQGRPAEGPATGKPTA